VYACVSAWHISSAATNAQKKVHETKWLVGTNRRVWTTYHTIADIGGRAF